MTAKPIPSPEYLRQRLRYEPETGKLFWLEWPAHGPKWNGRYAGREAFIGTMPKGYKQGRIDGRSLLAHRVIWAMVHGYWPVEIDHINHIRGDNRIVNLRAVDRAENSRNLPQDHRNKSGVAGVCWEKRRCTWLAQIQVQGRFVFLGYHADFDDAVRARKAAEIRFGFHANHGS